MQNGTRSRIHTLALSTLVIAANTLVGGCGKDKDKPDYHTREGRVASINQETGAFEGWFYSQKQKEEIKVPGRLDPNVEILINGATATVADVRVDDQVTVTAKVVKRGEEKEFIATKVEVIRPLDETVPAASAPEKETVKPTQ